MESLQSGALADRLERLERELNLQRQENQALAERLARETREGRTRFGVVIFLILAGAFGAVARLAYVARPGKVVSQLVEAEQFTLRDKNSKMRACLFLTPEGNPVLCFYDENEKGLLQIYTGHKNSDGISVGIQAFDTNGKERLLVGGKTGGVMGLTVYDLDGRESTALGVDKDKWSGVRVFDPRGTTRIDNGLRPDGSAGLIVYHVNGEKRKDLGIG